MDTNIVQLFYQAVARYPTHTAIVEGGKRISYDELHGQVQATAQALRKAGLRRGDRVLVFVPMGMALYRAVLALFHIGATAVFVDEWVNRSRLELCCNMADCRGFIGVLKARLYAWFSPALRNVPIRRGTSLPRQRVGEAIPVVAVAPDEVALITFTTGSTGTPKAAKRTHGFLHAQFQALLETLSPQPGEVDLTVLPIVLLLNLGVGATSVIVPYKPGKTGNRTAPQIWKQLNHQSVNRITASPYFVNLLAELAIKTGETLPSLKRIVTGGAPVFPDEAQRYLRAFPDTAVEVVYGSTEAEPISSVTAETLIAAGAPTSGLLVGNIYRNADVSIIPIKEEDIQCDAAAFKQLVLPNGKIGEIVVTGPHVLTAYFNNEEALRRNKIFVDGRCWHRTGDSGYIGSDGQLYLTGRCSALIWWAGKLISPFICEYWMRTIPGVRCGTVIQAAGGRLVAVVETVRNADKKRIANALYQFDLPEFRIYWMPQIPRDPRHHSKLDYDKLTRLVDQFSNSSNSIDT